MAVIAPFFRLEILHPPAGFAEALAACQAILLTSANGARALAEASHQRGRPILPVGDTTAATAEGLGFNAVTSASGGSGDLAELVRERLDPKMGPLLHVSGVDVASDLGEVLGRDGFDVRRFALYEAREADSLPASARAALSARALDVATFFSPRAAEVFAKLLNNEADLVDHLRDVTAIAISPAALAPFSGLPFKATRAAARPTRQAVLDDIDRLAADGVQGEATMSDMPSSPSPADTPSLEARPVRVRRGLGLFGAFITGVVAAVIVLAVALVTLPFWPEQGRVLWRGQTAALPATAPAIDLQAVRTDVAAVVNAAVDAVRRDLGARLDDYEKRLGALSATAAERPAPDPALAELRSRVEALESRPAPGAAQPAAPAAPTAPGPAADADKDKEVATLRQEIATLRTALQALDQAMAGQREQAREQVKSLSDAMGARGAAEQKALAAARASAVIGVAVRLSSALDLGHPFTDDLALLAPLIQGDAKLAESAAALQPYAQKGVPSRAALAAAFPGVAKAALAEDVADDSFGERVLGKLRGLVSLRRVGDVPGEAAEAKLARAGSALNDGDVAKPVELVKSLPSQVVNATSAWLARAEEHLAAKRAVDQLAAQAVTLLGAAR